MQKYLSLKYRTTSRRLNTANSWGKKGKRKKKERKKEKKKEPPEWSKYWPNLDSQLQARREETKKETDGELFLIEHIVMKFYKGGKIHNQSFSKSLSKLTSRRKKEKTPRKRKILCILDRASLW